MPRRTAAQHAADEAEKQRLDQEQPDTEMTEEHGDNAIQRETDNAWWCPLCDHSQTKLIDTCAGCGAVRDGDTVSKP